MLALGKTQKQFGLKMLARGKKSTQNHLEQTHIALLAPTLSPFQTALLPLAQQLSALVVVVAVSSLTVL
jgi:hypothetical protein